MSILESIQHVLDGLPVDDVVEMLMTAKELKRLKSAIGAGRIERAQRLQRAIMRRKTLAYKAMRGRG